jgi:hypothetical protein
LIHVRTIPTLPAANSTIPAMVLSIIMTGLHNVFQSIERYTSII